MINLFQTSIFYMTQYIKVSPCKACNTCKSKSQDLKHDLFVSNIHFLHEINTLKYRSNLHLTWAKRECFLEEYFWPARWINVSPIQRLTNGSSGHVRRTATYSPTVTKCLRQGNQNAAFIMSNGNTIKYG